MSQCENFRSATQTPSFFYGGLHCATPKAAKEARARRKFIEDTKKARRRNKGQPNGLNSNVVTKRTSENQVSRIIRKRKIDDRRNNGSHIIGSNHQLIRGSTKENSTILGEADGMIVPDILQKRIRSPLHVLSDISNKLDPSFVSHSNVGLKSVKKGKAPISSKHRGQSSKSIIGRLNDPSKLPERSRKKKRGANHDVPSNSGIKRICQIPDVVKESPGFCLMYYEGEHEELVDNGDPTFVCPFCKAEMWYDERIQKRKKRKEPVFSMCCSKGKVVLPAMKKQPEFLNKILTGNDPRWKNFAENIRAYNSMYAFTSIGGKVESAVNNGGGPPQFILSGQNYHRIGSLLPEPGFSPKFAQLYIYDTQNEISNRMTHFGNSADGGGIDVSIVKDLKEMMDEHNELAKTFRKARDYLDTNIGSKLCLRLFRGRDKDPRTYNLPTSDEIAALIVGDFEDEERGRDIIVKHIDGRLERLPESHIAFIPLQYPLMFPYGEDGYNEDTPYSVKYMKKEGIKRCSLTLREFIAYRIQDRANEHGNIVMCRRLFQQFLVDTYTMIEAQRLQWVKNNQNVIRVDFLKGVEEAIDRGETDASHVGKRIILPSSFTGGRRYMFNNCQDAMAVCKKFGYPDLFITMTCNTSWKEIRKFVRARDVRADERADVCCRVFKIKLEQMMKDIKSGIVFGAVDAGMYTIEFQKRGLPHAHILIWLKCGSKITTAADIDRHISAELPDPNIYPNLFQIVSSYMIHGPCGAAEPKSPCMENRRCTKLFPKLYQDSTLIDENGYPAYRRRKSDVTVTKKGTVLDNAFVVPYNPKLLMRYRGHINVEYCNKSNAIKYLFKYVTKGPDRVNVQISSQQDGVVKEKLLDEVKQFYDCRYLTPCEAVWRIFALDIHSRWPAVKRLPFHLPNEQSVLFRDNSSLDDAVNRPSTQFTKFMAWMDANTNFKDARELSYAEFPNCFVFNERTHCWQRRKKGYAVGRLQYIPPGTGEIYYLRILLTVQKGCKNFEDIRTVHGVVYDTFHDACYALGLLADDREYIDAIKEASEYGYAHQLRRLFVTLLMTNTMSKPELVWEKSWRLLSDDILYRRRKVLNMPDFRMCDEDLKNLCLIEVEKLLHANGRSLKEFSSLPFPSDCEDLSHENRFLADELNYNRDEMRDLEERLVNSLTDEQRGVYQEVLGAVNANVGGFFFLYGFGGTGKTFVWNTLSASIRSKGWVVLNVASSGIASLLLPGGRTAHSRFSIPLSIDKSSTCNIKHGSPRAELLQKARLIIWDEAPMLNKYCFEALDRTLNDLMGKPMDGDSYVPFGGKVVVLGGDFRQILPVIQKGSRSAIVGATVNSSYLWKWCSVLRLTRNMRLFNCQSNTEAADVRFFADWILQVGNGDAPVSEVDDTFIDIPSDLLIKDAVENPLETLIEFTYPDMLHHLHVKNFKYFEERALLAPTLDSVEAVNNLILSKFPGDGKEYLSMDSACSSDKDMEVEGAWFTTEFLNDVKCSGIPNHRILLKVGVPIMLLRNIDQSCGLCNGTRLIVAHLEPNVIIANVVSGSKAGQQIYIPRMNLIPSDAGLPFKFQRRQFPIALCFAMTINKSQGQSLSHVGLYLPKAVFTHGQLYVALSRVKSRDGLKILILDQFGEVCSSTKNVVYKEVFENV